MLASVPSMTHSVWVSPLHARPNAPSGAFDCRFKDHGLIVEDAMWHSGPR